MKNEARQQRRQAVKDAKKAAKKTRAATPTYGDLPMPGNLTDIADRMDKFTEEEEGEFQLVKDEFTEHVEFFTRFMNQTRLTIEWTGTDLEYSKSILYQAAASTEHHLPNGKTRFTAWIIDAILIPVALRLEEQYATNA